MKLEDDGLLNYNDGNIIPSGDYYGTYHGHEPSHLYFVYRNIRRDNNTLIFLAGDSSLDNKFWFKNSSKAVNGYENVLTPPKSREDIAYWLNMEAIRRGKEGKMVAINCAVEESTVGSRACNSLLPADKFIRDNIQAQDVLIVSVGGNDIALRPSICTICNMLCLVCCTTTECIENVSCGFVLPCDDYVGGCTTSCWSSLLACPPGFGYFLHLFGPRIKKYVTNVTEVNKPELVLVCMIYFLDEHPTPSWANTTLSLLGYNRDPKKLQAIIRKVFEQAVSRIKIPGTKVVPVPMFRTLDGKTPADYVQRVEPSSRGGQKLACQFMDAIWNNGAVGLEIMER